MCGNLINHTPVPHICNTMCNSCEVWEKALRRHQAAILTTPESILPTFTLGSFSFQYFFRRGYVLVVFLSGSQGILLSSKTNSYFMGCL